MTTQFEIQDSVEETRVDSMYRAVGKDGKPLLLTRTRLDSNVRDALMESGVFDQALTKLRSLEFDYLRVVIDGGMEQELGPWLTSHWLDAKPLCACKMGDKDLRDLARQFKEMVSELGVTAGKIDFDERHVLTLRSEEGELSCLFRIKDSRLLQEFADGRVPGVELCAEREEKKVIENLAVERMRLPKLEQKKDSIPLVDERSPALNSYPTYREPWLGQIMFWGTAFACLFLIWWFTAK